MNILDWTIAKRKRDNLLRFFGKFSVQCLRKTLNIPMVSGLSLQAGQMRFYLPVFPP
jgi:hypothetical protein